MAQVVAGVRMGFNRRPQPMNASLRQQLLIDPPSFHHWNGASQIGGFDAGMLLFLERLLMESGASQGVAFETGAGLTSAWLLSVGVLELHSFYDRSEVSERIHGYLAPFPALLQRWHSYVGPSQLTLPQKAISMDSPTADFCLLDGGHGLDTVFNDFIYLNYVLKPHGLLAIDDLQLGSCRLLLEFLMQPKAGFSFLERRGKLAVLRKTGQQRLLGDFGWHRPFLDKLSAWLNQPPE